MPASTPEPLGAFRRVLARILLAGWILGRACSVTAIGDTAGGHWAYRALQTPAIPEVNRSGWADTAIDRFILMRIEAEGLAPSPEADRATLCRRLHFNLTGLPPTVAELEAFETDPRPDAWEQLVDRLLASPRFGEHWGRHWFDVVRYGESVTLRGFIFKEAWRYRDYVIEAFNRAEPIDQFLREQVAGDLLPWESRGQRWRQLVAATFLMLGNTNLEEQDKRQLEMDFVDEQLDVIGKAFLGQTLSCARCHDHKFDPIPTRDYYALAGILKNLDCLQHDNVSAWVEQRLPVEPEYAQACEERDRAVAAAADALKQARDQLKAAQSARGAGKNEAGAATGAGKDTVEELGRRVRELEGEWKRRQAAGPKWPMVMAPREATNIVDLAVHRRGSVHSLGGVVRRGFPAFGATAATAERMPGTRESGRRELADWLVSPANPLTARVFVNRVWLWMLGDGLVRSPDNFGTTGEAPTHPELLDHLAAQFTGAVPTAGTCRVQPWSLKSLVREIALSRVYRLSSEASSAQMKTDPANRWWAHARARRLTAEELRDALLTFGSGLNLEAPGGPTFPVERPADFDFVFQRPLRSVYVPVFRNALPTVFDAFDFPQAAMVTGRREESLVPSQSLFLFNDSFVAAQAAAVGRDWSRRERARSVSPAIADLYRVMLGRRPSPGELRVVMEHLNGGGDRAEAWSELVHAVFASADFQWIR